MEINRLVSLEGDENPNEEQLLLEHNAQEEMGVLLGDNVPIQLPDGSIKIMEVVGIVLDMTTSAGDFLAAPLGYINFDSLGWLGQPENYNRLYATVEGEPNDIAYIQQYLTRLLIS
jgi:hypothetical protein